MTSRIERPGTSEGASESPHGVTAEDRPGDYQPGDLLSLAQEAKVRRRSPGRLAGLLRVSVRLAWGSDHTLFSLSAGLQLAAGLLIVAQVVVIKLVLAALLGSRAHGGSLHAAIVPVALLALVTGFSSIANAFQQQCQRLLSELVTRRTWEGILDVSTSVRLRQYDTPDFYDHLQRVQANALGRPYMLTQSLLALVGGFASSVGLVVAVIALQPLLVPLLLISAVPFYLGMRRGGNLEFSFAVAQTPRMRRRTYLQRVLTGRGEAKEIRAFGTAGALRHRYAEVYQAFITDLRRHVKRRSAVSVLSSLASAVALALTMFVIVWLVADHQLSLAAAGAAIVAVRMLAGQITGVFGNIQGIFESGLFLEDLERFLGNSSGRSASPPPSRPAPSGFTCLDVQQVSFTYPGGHSPALSGVELHLRRGEVVALVGENGSGKTTLAKLLAALYEPDSGTIRWDGVDIAGFDAGHLRRAIGVIFQDFVRYELSAGANVALGRPEGDETDPAIVDAARRSGAAAMIEALPLGFNTVLSKEFAGGHELSGGQWQRVALARAFYRGAPFVILDEPSAALDPRAEHELFESLRRVLAGRTVLFISHRLATVRSADRIYVLAGGQIVEQGTHEELMALGGRYAELFHLQAGAYLGGPGGD